MNQESGAFIAGSEEQGKVLQNGGSFSMFAGAGGGGKKFIVSAGQARD